MCPPLCVLRQKDPTMARIDHQRNESGFTLIELLVVILIIGILAAIALPAFLSQRAKAQDADAKSDARNMESQIEACWHNTGGYVGCAASLTANSTGLSIGGAPGQVQIVQETTNGYEITAMSVSNTGGPNHTYTVIHNIGGIFDRQCAPAGQGGCQSDGSW